MNPNQALWEKGDFTKVAAFMRPAGEAVARSLGVEPGMRVLDLGCGDGTTALPLARLGARVRGVDIASNLVEAGRRRAAEEGLEGVSFEQGDACRLDGIGDDSFDVTISFFGAMFAPKPHDVAREMVRVTRPGGRVVMGNWIPNDPTSFVSQLLKISSAFTPPPPEGWVSPTTWGVEEHVIERFGQAGIPREAVTMTKDTFTFASGEVGPEDFIDVFRRFYGPTMNAFESAEKDGRTEELRARLVELAISQNRADGPGFSIPATYMRVTAGAA